MAQFASLLVHFRGENDSLYIFESGGKQKNSSRSVKGFLVFFFGFSPPLSLFLLTDIPRADIEKNKMVHPLTQVSPVTPSVVDDFSPTPHDKTEVTYVLPTLGGGEATNTDKRSVDTRPMVQVQEATKRVKVDDAIAPYFHRALNPLETFWLARWLENGGSNSETNFEDYLTLLKRERRGRLGDLSVFRPSEDNMRQV